jgi:hypothetical protein
MAMTGYFYTFTRARTALPMSMIKYDPISTIPLSRDPSPPIEHPSPASSPKIQSGNSQGIRSGSSRERGYLLTPAVSEQSGGESCFSNKNERVNDRNSQDGGQRQGAREQGRTRIQRWSRKDTGLAGPDPSPGGHLTPRDTTLRGHVLYQDSPVYSYQKHHDSMAGVFRVWEAD